MKDWNGGEVQAALSKRGVVLLADFSDNLLRDPDAPWPPPAIVQKLYESRQGSRFEEGVSKMVSRRLGFYSDLQSINSEDAITWSYFGLLAARPPHERATFLNWLLGQIDLEEIAHSTYCTIDLWRRVPHPERVTTPGGPELDVVLDGDRAVVFVEAKWRSKEGVGQGIEGTKTQLQLRRDFLGKYGRVIYGDRGFVVLGVVLDEPLETATPADALGIHTKAIRWSDLAEYPDHPRAAEFGRYYDWKLEHSTRRGKSLKPLP
jgi:hypothetical protein